MRERVYRDRDESIYQPRIHADRIRELHLISAETHLPMTVLVDFAIRSYVQAYKEEKLKRETLRDEVAFNMESNYEQKLVDHEFDDTDEWEDLSIYLDHC